MKDNEILEEIWAFREAYAAKFNYDIDAMCRDLREQAKREGLKLVSFPPRRPEGWVEPLEPAVKPDAFTAEASAEYDAEQAVKR